MRFGIVADIDKPIEDFDIIAIEQPSGTVMFTKNKEEDKNENARIKKKWENMRKNKVDWEFFLDFRSTYRWFMVGDYDKDKNIIDQLIQKRFGYTQEEIDAALK